MPSDDRFGTPSPHTRSFYKGGVPLDLHGAPLRKSSHSPDEKIPKMPAPLSLHPHQNVHSQYRPGMRGREFASEKRETERKYPRLVAVETGYRVKEPKNVGFPPRESKVPVLKKIGWLLFLLNGLRRKGPLSTYDFHHFPHPKLCLGKV